MAGGVHVLVLAGALLAGIGWLVAMPVVAAAQPPPCPDAPAAYEGADDVVNEVRALRTDQRAACLAVVDGLDVIHTRLGGTIDVSSAAPLVVTGSELAAIADNTDPENAPPPAEVDTQAVVDAVDAAQLELDAALWFIAGLLVALFAGAWLAREALG